MSELEAELTSWLHKIVATKEPPAGILAFRFGLDEEGCLPHLAGSKVYDEADAAWAAYPPDYLAEREVTIAEEEMGEWQDILLAVIRFLGITLRRVGDGLSGGGGGFGNKRLTFRLC